MDLNLYFLIQEESKVPESQVLAISDFFMDNFCLRITSVRGFVKIDSSKSCGSC